MTIYWQSKDGPIAVDQMTETHVKSVLKMLIKNDMIKRPRTEETEDELLAIVIEDDETEWGKYERPPSILGVRR